MSKSVVKPEGPGHTSTTKMIRERASKLRHTYIACLILSFQRLQVCSVILTNIQV
jgi:hypothetical protein